MSSTTGSTWRASMPIKPIRTDEDLRAVFRRLAGIYQADEGTPEADERDVLVTLIEAYENRHYAFGSADPVEASSRAVRASRNKKSPRPSLVAGLASGHRRPGAQRRRVSWNWVTGSHVSAQSCGRFRASDGCNLPHADVIVVTK